MSLEWFTPDSVPILLSVHCTSLDRRRPSFNGHKNESQDATLMWSLQRYVSKLTQEPSDYYFK